MKIIIIFYIKLPHFYAIYKLVRHIRYTVNSGYYKLAYTQPQEVVVLFTQFDWLLSSRYSPMDKNKMASRFILVTDKQICVLNEAAVSPNMKKPQSFV